MSMETHSVNDSINVNGNNNANGHINANGNINFNLDAIVAFVCVVWAGASGETFWGRAR